MAASKLKLQGLQDQLKEKDKLICALQADKQSYLATAAQEARNEEYGKMNRGWRKHNVMPHEPMLIRGKGATKDEKKQHRYGEGVFITDYIFIVEKVNEMDLGAERAEAQVQKLRDKHRCLPQDARIDWGSGGARDQAGEGNENKDSRIFP